MTTMLAAGALLLIAYGAALGSTSTRLDAGEQSLASEEGNWHRLAGVTGRQTTSPGRGGVRPDLSGWAATGDEPGWVLQFPMDLEDAGSGVSDDEERWLLHSEGYPPLSSVSHYPWAYIAEPHRPTQLRVPASFACTNGCAYRWTFALLLAPDTPLDGTQYYFDAATAAAAEAGAAAQTLEQFVTTEPKATFVFLNVSREYKVTVEQLLPGQSEAATDSRVLASPGAAAAPAAAAAQTRTVRVMCKYVRRELRLLRDVDRERYFSAFAVVAAMPGEEGRERYGAAFKNLQYMMVKHIHNEQCSPFHNGNGFFTSHAALTLELEQSLQAVDPAVTQPLWDFTVDSNLYGNDWSKASPLFRRDWFGAATPLGADRAVRPTWLPGGIPVPRSYDRPVRNSYGLVTNNINNNPSPLVTRAHEFCGLENRLPLPGCTEYLGCMTSQTTLAGLRACCEGELHRDMHMGIGGEWDCNVDFGELAAADSRLAPLLGKIGIAAVKLHNSVWANGYLVLPDRCDSDAPFESCRGSCPALDPCVGSSGCETADAGSGGWMDFDAAFAVLQEVGIVDALKRLTLPGAMDFEGRLYSDARFEGLDDEASRALWVALLQHACHPGKFGNMGTGASSGDIIFWPLHPFFDRMWAYMRLDRDGTFSVFDWSWEDDATACYGHNSADAMPFRNLFGESENFGGTDPAAAERYYNNEDLVRLFDPRNPALPYVYADFDWTHCQQADLQSARDARQVADAAAAAEAAAALAGGGGSAAGLPVPAGGSGGAATAAAAAGKVLPALSDDPNRDPELPPLPATAAAAVAGSGTGGTGGSGGAAKAAPVAPPRVDNGAERRDDGPAGAAGTMAGLS